MVGEKGFEPSRSFEQRILSPWRLPIPPLPGIKKGSKQISYEPFVYIHYNIFFYKNQTRLFLSDSIAFTNSAIPLYTMAGGPGFEPRSLTAMDFESISLLSKPFLISIYIIYYFLLNFKSIGRATSLAFLLSDVTLHYFAPAASIGLFTEPTPVNIQPHVVRRLRPHLAFCFTHYQLLFLLELPPE